MVKENRFRSDLYYRLNVFPISVPPLRERPGDVRLLAEHFVRRFSLQQGKTIDGIPEDVMIALEQHCWPGNIRELQNAIERGMIMTIGPVLSRRTTDQLVVADENSSPAFIRTLADVERAHIIAALRATEWVVGGAYGAAAHLGVPRTTLLSRMQRLGISRQPGQRWTRKRCRGIVALRDPILAPFGDNADALRAMEAVSG
jgi:formate hydrogenlyase transcriptional activator